MCRSDLNGQFDQNLNTSIWYYRWSRDSDDAAITYSGGSTVKTNSIFVVNSPGDYSIAANIYCDDGLTNDRATLYAFVRVYTGQSDNVTRGTHVHDYVFGSAYYRDDSDTYDSFNMGGVVRIYISAAMIALGCQFEICSTRIEAQNTGSINASQSLSLLRVERLVYTLE